MNKTSLVIGVLLFSLFACQKEQNTVIYDIENRISRYENAFGDFIEFTYDANDRVASALGGNGRSVSYTYSQEGTLTDIDGNSYNTV
ncbi:MAG: hypothetical protein EOM16_09325, partial [Bacteroidia bacterium]|nr:hypothetical protein [Bacteroidia bacterium]